MPSYQDNKRGIVALLSACAIFTVADTFTKITALAYPTGEVLFARSILCLLIVGAALAFSHGTMRMPGALKPMVLTRALLDAAANATFVIALSRMRLADLLAINLTSPLILTMLAAFFLREPIGWRRWSAIAVGVSGMLLIVKPSPDSIDVWALVALGTAFASATRDLATRRIDPSVPTLTITFVSLVAVSLSGLLVAVLFGEQWRMFTPEYLGFMALAAVFLSFGSTLAVAAFRNVDVSVLAPFRYSLLLWGALSGYFVFGEVSDRVSIFGSLLIVGSGLYTFHRERVRHRDLSTRSAIR